MKVLITLIGSINLWFLDINGTIAFQKCEQVLHLLAVPAIHNPFWYSA